MGVVGLAGNGKGCGIEVHVGPQWIWPMNRRRFAGGHIGEGHRLASEHAQLIVVVPTYNEIENVDGSKSSADDEGLIVGEPGRIALDQENRTHELSDSLRLVQRGNRHDDGC